MVSFFHKLRHRNPLLYWFGWFCLTAALICIILVFTTETEVLGISAWIKPFKFFLSSAIFSWSMGWLMDYLNEQTKVNVYSWVVIVVLTFETVYIAVQAGLGEMSHFNESSQFHLAMFGLMGFAIGLMTLWTAYIGWLFFRKPLPELSRTYLWGIRLGIILFVIFALQGGVMASNMGHTIGAPDGGEGLPLVNWSTRYGDLRVAHFMGMHALQVIPLLSFYFFNRKWQTILFGIAYFLLVTALMIQALMGVPLLRY